MMLTDESTKQLRQTQRRQAAEAVHRAVRNLLADIALETSQRAIAATYTEVFEEYARRRAGTDRTSIASAHEAVIAMDALLGRLGVNAKDIRLERARRRLIEAHAES